MKDKPEIDPQKDDPGLEVGDAGDLDAEEQKAFDRIMAEVSGEKDPAEDGAQLNDEELGKLDDILDGANSPEASQAEGAEASSSEEGLTKEQEEALNQIMAEIEGKETEDQREEKDDPPEPMEPAAAEKPPERAGDAPPSQGQEPGEEDADDGEGLDSDQEEALQKIMAEIEDRGKEQQEAAEKAVNQEPSPGDAAEDDNADDLGDNENDDDDVELTADQEDALSKIMAEIESRDQSQSEAADEATAQPVKSAGAESPSPADPGADEGQEEAEPEEDLEEDQEAALSKIMAEIEARNKERVDDEDVKPPPAPKKRGKKADKSAGKKEADDAVEGLSMEDFNAELEKLVIEAEKDEEEKRDKLLNQGTSASAESTPVSEEEEAGAQTDGASAEAEVQEGIAAEDANQAKTDGAAQDSMATEKPATEKPAVLREISVEETKTAKRRNKKLFFGLGGGFALILLAVGAYWIFSQTNVKISFVTPTDEVPGPVSPPPMSVPEPTIAPSPLPPQETAPPPAAQLPAPVQATEPLPGELSPDMRILHDIHAKLADMMSEIRRKQREIEELKDYYGKGIEEIEREIIAEVDRLKINGLKEGIQSKKIELGLRTIQRRMAYIEKLDQPFEEVYRAGEELLYLKRKTTIFEEMMNKTSGIDTDPLERQVEEAIERIRAIREQLSIDEIDIQPPPMGSVWKKVMAARPSLSAKRLAPNPEDLKNHAIGEEICGGTFDRMAQLTKLDSTTAECLTKWPGKDLYINELDRLTAEAAKALSQWHGDWLVLNGLTELSAQTARYLAQWQGKRLSLNGLTELSPKATAYLSRWEGEQLELVGLKHMGQWDNPGVTLFLSDKLNGQLAGGR